MNSVSRAQETESPGLKGMKKQMTMGGNSPSKIGGQTFGSPNKTNNKSPSKLTAKARRAGKSPKKSGETESKDKKESGLASQLQFLCKTHSSLRMLMSLSMHTSIR